MGAVTDKPQCPFFRQTAIRSLGACHFSGEVPLIHRVIHRSCGAALRISQMRWRDRKKTQTLQRLGYIPPCSLQSNWADRICSVGSITIIHTATPLTRQSEKTSAMTASRVGRERGAVRGTIFLMVGSAEGRRGLKVIVSILPGGCLRWRFSRSLLSELL